MCFEQKHAMVYIILDYSGFVCMGEAFKLIVNGTLFLLLSVTAFKRYLVELSILFFPFPFSFLFLFLLTDRMFSQAYVYPFSNVFWCVLT